MLPIGFGVRPMQPQVQQPARQLSPVRQYLNAMQQYRQGGMQGTRPTYAQFRQPQPGMSAIGGGRIVGAQPMGIAGGGTGMPPIQPMPDMFKPQISGGPIGQPMPDMFKPQISGGPVGIAGGGTGMPPIQPMSDMFKPQISGGPVGMPPIQPMSDPFKPQVSGGPIGQPMPDPFKPQISGGPVGMAGGVTGTPPIPPVPPMPPMGGFGSPMGQVQQVQQIVGQQPTGRPPMAMKTGGLAVKAVWDKERPEDLNKPKSLSVKKKKAAKARAKAAGRPYPNLVDNMAAARKKGK
jgi:hypothetical protein